MKFKHLLISSRSLLTRFKSIRHLYTITPKIPNSRIPNFSNPISTNPNFIKSVRNLHSETLDSNQFIEKEEEEDNNDDTEEEEEDETMTEFLSRFVWIMRGKLTEAYPTSDKPTVNAMLLVIVENVVEEIEKGAIEEMLLRVSKGSSPLSAEFSEDLWKTVWEVSSKVLEDMKKERKKQEIKVYAQCEEVKEMCRFASEVGVRGNMLREFRFQWAKEKMEEVEYFRNLERIRDEEFEFHREEDEANTNVGEIVSEEVVGTESDVSAEVQMQPRAISLPQRRGTIKYKIYGLDLSEPKWADIANTIHQSEKHYVPEEPKEITGKCKLVTEKILNLTEDNDDLLNLLAEWVELLGPSRVDWFALLDKLKERNTGLYSKVSELLLDEDSFQANIRDYSKLIAAYSKDDRIPDAERILEKMTTKGIQPDILTHSVLVHMYSKAGKLDQAKESYEQLKDHGFQPDLQAYTAMIMAYVNSGQPKSGENIMREMESRDIKPTKEIYMALLSSFSSMGHVDHIHRISTTMQFAGLHPNLEWSTLLVEAHVNAGDYEKARKKFDDMKYDGIKPDDRCVASMLKICYKKNFLDKALDIMLKLEKDGFKPGIQTDTIWLDWFVKLGLIEEAEEVYKRLKETGETKSIGVQVSLCSMYLATKDEKKALQTLGILEGKKDELGKDDFERIINGLMSCGLMQDALKFNEMMEARGFYTSEAVRMSLKMAQVSQTMRGGKRPSMLKK